MSGLTVPNLTLLAVVEAAILGMNHPESLAPTTAGLSTREGELDPARASTAAAPSRGGSSAVSEGCDGAEASDYATAAGTRASALRGLVPNGVSCTSARVGDQAVCDPPAGSGYAVTAPDVWVRACNPISCMMRRCGGHIAHHWCVLQEMRTANRRDAMRCNAMSTSRTIGVCCKRCEQPTGEMQ